MVDITNKTKITTFPQTSVEYDKWIASGREFISGQWYESTTTPTPSPTPTISEITPGMPLPQEGGFGMMDGVKYQWSGGQWNLADTTAQKIVPGMPTPTEGQLGTMDGIEYKWSNEQWNPIDKAIPEKEIIGEDEDVVGTSDLAREEDEGTQEKIDIAKQVEDDQTEIQKLTAKQQLQTLREEMGLDKDTGLPRPALPTYVDDFEALRAEQGVTALETHINTLESQIRDTEASLRQGLYDEEGKLRPMELIGTRQRELARQVQEQLDTLNRRKQTLVDELSTKNTLISNIMTLKQLDYNAASTAYNQEFTQKVQLLNIVEGRIDRADQEANRQRDDARANLSIYHNMIKDVSWDQVGSNLRTAIEALEAKAGFPVGITEAFTRANPGISVDYTTTGYDANGNQVVSFFSYNDGIPKLITAITTSGVKAGTGEAEIARQSELGIIGTKIATYMDKWKAEGDKGAGTREEFAAFLATQMKELTYQEIYEEIKRMVTDQWLEDNKRFHIGGWRLPV